MNNRHKPLESKVIDKSVKMVWSEEQRHIIDGSYQVVRSMGEIVFVAKYMRDIDEALADKNSYLSTLKDNATVGNIFKVSREHLSGVIIKEN